MTHADTHRLTRASLELRSRDGRRKRAATVVTVLVVILLAGGAALYLRAPVASPFAATALARENASLRAELERTRMEFDMERATRAELNRQAGELNARINELTNRLEFLAARDSRINQPH